MKVNFLDLKRQYLSIKKDVDASIQKVLDSQYFILGETVKEFEKKIAEYCGVKYAIGVASGTDALLLSLKATSVGQNRTDLVITTPFTFFATAGAIVNSGAQPLFVDIDPRTFNIDPNKIIELFTENPNIISRVKAIIPIHLFGQISEMDPIRKITKKYGIVVIEDACQAIGAEFKGKKAGSFGDLGCFSFFPTKNLGGYGDGGMVITNNKEYAEKVRKLRVHGSTEKYYHKIVGFNSRLDAIHASILLAKVPYLDKWLKLREEKANYYTRYLSKIQEIETPFTTNHNKHTYHQYTIRIKEGLRDKMKNYLEAQNINTNIYYPLPLHLQECFIHLKYKRGDFIKSENAAKNVLSLPIYPELKKEEIDYCIETIRSFIDTQ